MERIIWICWFQGWNDAPLVVKKCLNSWKQHNPDWKIICLDSSSINYYVDLNFLNLSEITPTSLSDIVRILLLKEYGGVWVDSTTFCNQPLDQWLPQLMTNGFFAFSRPAPDRMLSSWFLAAREHSYIVNKWCRETVNFWTNIKQVNDYFWFHHLFGDVYKEDEHFRVEWDNTQKISADGPHSPQIVGLLRGASSEVVNQVDWDVPLFKLTYKYDVKAFTSNCLLNYIFNKNITSYKKEPDLYLKTQLPLLQLQYDFASLKVSTQNLGDHIQIYSGLNLLKRLNIYPKFYIDRDDEIAEADLFNNIPDKVFMLMNGWFKTNPKQWPPNSKIIPLFIGFHIRLFQAPTLISDVAIDYYKNHEPIGCRDVYTQNLLMAKGVNAKVSQCLTFLFSRRFEYQPLQNSVYVTSRDKEILEILPSNISNFTFVNHYVDERDFDLNMSRAIDLINGYERNAKLIITTLLHCAIPAIAMGIPVVVFYPKNNQHGHESDKERFSSLSHIIRIYHFEEINQVDWSPKPISVAHIKLNLIECFMQALENEAAIVNV